MTPTRHITPYLLHAESQIPHEPDMQTCMFSRHFSPHFLLPFSPLTYHNDFLTPIPWPSLSFSSFQGSGAGPLTASNLQDSSGYCPISTLNTHSKGKGFCELEDVWHVYSFGGGDGHPVPADFSSAPASEQAKAAKAAPESVSGCSPQTAWWGTVQYKIAPVLVPLNPFLVVPFAQMKTQLIHTY